MAARRVRPDRRTTFPISRAAAAAEDRRRPRRRGVEGGAAADDVDQWVSYNPNRGDKMPDVYTHRRPHRLRRSQHLLRVPLLRQRARQDPHQRQPSATPRSATTGSRISLDSAGTGQTAYHLFSNPSAQPDGRAQHVGVRRAVRRRHGLVQRREDHQPTATSSKCRSRCRRCASPAATRCGWAWSSSARSAASAYSYAWPEMLPGQWVFDRPSHLMFSNLKPRRLVELLPSVTYGVNQAARDRRRVEPAPTTTSNVGASGKFGITSGITLDGTDQSRLQPGRERRVPGAGQPALPGVLLGEAAVLHGGHGPVQHRRHRRRRQHAHRRPHPPHRRSDLRRAS